MIFTDEQIKFMKENKVPFGLLSDDERELFNVATSAGFRLQCFGSEYRARNVWCKARDLFLPSHTYRLSPNYEQAPEKIELPEKFVVTCKGYFKELTETDSKINDIIDYLSDVDRRLSKLEGGNQ